MAYDNFNPFVAYYHPFPMLFVVASLNHPQIAMIALYDTIQANCLYFSFLLSF